MTLLMIYITAYQEYIMLTVASFVGP